MNLILIEGIAGSGKSSTAHLVGLHLAKLGYDVQWWFEQDEAHPIYPATQRLQYDREIDAGERSAIRDAVLARWRALAASLQGTKKIVLVECGFLQMAIDFHLLLDLPMAEAAEHVLAVEKLIVPLDPLLVLLYEPDVEAGLRRVLTDRTSGWADYLVQVYRQSPYGRRRGICDYEGVIAAIAQTRPHADAIVSRLGLRKLIVETSAGDWSSYYGLIMRELGMPPLVPIAGPPANAAMLAGHYCCGEAAGQGYQVTVGADALHVSRQARLRLLPKQGNTFHILGTRWEVEFTTDAAGLAQMATLTDPGAGVCEVWRRVPAHP
jgi:thymidylate kinase